MKEYKFFEQDWKLFKSKIAIWQENYIDKLNKEYIELLSENTNPSDKFWNLDKRIKTDRNKVGVEIEMRRSILIYNITSLINEGVISLEELEEFSDELNKRVKNLLSRCENDENISNW